MTPPPDNTIVEVKDVEAGPYTVLYVNITVQVSRNHFLPHPEPNHGLTSVLVNDHRAIHPGIFLRNLVQVPEELKNHPRDLSI